MIRTTIQLASIACVAAASPVLAAGVWRALPVAPHLAGGGMLLLTDGTVLCKTISGPAFGNVWMKLTPNAQGSYLDGSWSTLGAMNHTRYYFSSQVLRDGRVYVAGGEYGTGKANAEIYDPTTNAWTMLPSPGGNISDANSELLPDGRVLQARVTGDLRSTVLFNPATGTYSAGPSCIGIHNESAWVKLADDTILMVDRGSTNSERYHPSINAWLADAIVPVPLYDTIGLETGGGVLLPDGRALFFGSLGPTAYYTLPASGTVGGWTAGPTIPDGYGTPDAPCVMLVNGRVLIAASPKPTSGVPFPKPTRFFELDPVGGAFTALPAPDGTPSVDEYAFAWTFLALPDGNVLCSRLETSQYYIYEPDGSPITEGRPQVNSIVRTGRGRYTVGGTGFNGISQGAGYGDDWQMATNYPVIRLTAANGVVRYARTTNWSSTGVQTGSLPMSTTMQLPAGVPAGIHQLEVTANGIASAPVPFFVASATCPADHDLDGTVGGADVTLVLSAWGTSGVGAMGLGDIDGDGTVGAADLTAALSAWGSCP